MKHPILNEPENMQELIAFLEGDADDQKRIDTADENITHWISVQEQHHEGYAKYLRAKREIERVQREVRDARGRQAVRKQLNNAIDRFDRTAHPQPTKGF